MKIALILLLLALASATPSLSQAEQNHQINPLNHGDPTENKIQNKRTLFGHNPYIYGRTRHIGIHPLGYKYLLQYGAPRYNYLVKPSVTYLKPVFQNQGWKPIIKPMRLRPVGLGKPVVLGKPHLHAHIHNHPHPHTHIHAHTPVHQVVEKPLVVHTPVIEKPVVEVKPAVVQHLQPVLPPNYFQFTNGFIPSPVIPQQSIWPQQIPVNPQVLQPIPVQPALTPVQPAPVYPLFKPEIPQLLRPVLPFGGHFHLLNLPKLPPFGFQQPGQNVGVPLHFPQHPQLQPWLPQFHPQQTLVHPQQILPHGNHLDVVPQHQHLFPQPVNHLHVDQGHIHADQGQILHDNQGNHIHFEQGLGHVDQGHLHLNQGHHFLNNQGHHIHLDQGHAHVNQGQIHIDQGHHLLDNQGHHIHFNQGHAHVDQGHHLLDNQGHHLHHDNVHENPEHVHTEQHIHPEQPNVVHTEQHVHQDHSLLPAHVHPVHPAPQIPLYLPQHPNYKPGITLQPIVPGNAVQTEFSATFPKYPLLGVHT